MRRPRRRRRGRAPFTAALVTLLVLAAIAYGFDWVARTVADNRVAATVRAGTHESSVRVSIDGAFFLPQVVAGDYQHVVVQMNDLAANGLTVASLRTDLYGVHLPFRDVLHNDVRTITVNSSREQALVTYPEVNAYLASRGQHLTIAYAGGGAALISTVLTAFGQSFPVGADASVTPGQSYVDIVPTRVVTRSSIVNAIGDAVLKLRLAFRIPMTPLPFGQRIVSVTPTAAGLALTAAGGNLVLTRQGVTVG